MINLFKSFSVKTNPLAYGHPLYQGGNSPPLDKEGVGGDLLHTAGKIFKSFYVCRQIPRPTATPFINGVIVPLLIKRG